MLGCCDINIFFSRSSAAPATAGFYSSWSRNENIISPKAQDESSSRSRTSINPRQGFPDSINRCSPVDVVGYLPSLMTSCWEVPTSRFLLSLSNSGQRPCCFAFDTAAPNHVDLHGAASSSCSFPPRLLWCHNSCAALCFSATAAHGFHRCG